MMRDKRMTAASIVSNAPDRSSPCRGRRSGDTVGRIVAFLQRENLVPAPPAQSMSAV